MMFEKIPKDLSELVRLIRLSERYCTAIAARPELVTPESHEAELARERRIADLSHLYGITS